MGFGPLLGMDIDSITGRLNYVLLDNYDPTRNRLKVNKEWIMISEELVHDMMGLPMGGENIKKLESYAYDDPVLQQWKAQFPRKLTYVYSVKVPVNDSKKGKLFIRYVRTSHLEEIEVEEINQNMLGMGDIEQRIVADGETSNTDIDLQQVQREYGNVEAYCAVVELGYNKIVFEKMNLEKALNDGLEKFPDNGILKEWLNKKRMLFNEDDEIMDEDLDENEEDGDDVRKNDEGDEGEKDKDIESNIAEHVTSGDIVGLDMASDVNVNVQITDRSRVGEYQAEEHILEKEVYDIPKTVAHGECAYYSGTQFLEDPVVLEQVLDVSDKTSERYYEGHVSRSGKMEGNLENESGIGNVTSRVLDKGKNILTNLDNADEVDEDDVKGKRRVKVSQPLKSPFVK
ncbi:hypothetical protein L1887_38932 [Cichorium endivia]|nr:hypothetical protein L1887_38932 [Cichorium endivia]